MADLTEIPSTIRGGTTVPYTRTFPSYPANGGWTAKLHLRGKSVLDVTGSPSGAAFVFTLSATDTAGLEAGPYDWFEIVQDGAGERKEAASGKLEVLPDPRELGAGAALTHEQRMLDALTAKLEGRLETDMERYGIYGREVDKIPINTVRAMWRDYKQRVWRQLHPGKFGPQVRVEFTGTSNEV